MLNKLSNLLRVFLGPAVALVMLGALVSNLQGFADSGRRWSSNSVLYYVNPQSLYVSPDAAVSALKTAAAAWTQQSQANIELLYAGTTNGSSLTLNYKNEVFFRNGSDGTSVAETHSWWRSSTNEMLDSDIVFYEGAYTFFALSGCSGGIYVENVATHEFGHLLGLGHSDLSGATMAPKMLGYCDRTWLTLATDDVAGIETMYPGGNSAKPPVAPSQLSVALSTSSPTSSLVLSWSDNATNEGGYRVERSADGSSFAQIAQVGANVTSYTNTNLAAGATYYYRVTAYNGDGVSDYSNTATGQTAAATPANTAPVVAVASPATTASYPEGASITFSGSANDTQDGNLSASLTWTSSLAGPIGSGASFSRTLPAGTHLITASVTDSGGLRTSNQVTVTVNASAPAVPKPAAPSQLSVALSTSAPTSSLVLSWSDNASNESGYRVERSADGSSFAQIAQVGANVRSYANTNLAAGATYYYRVAAYNEGGVSGYSNTAAGQTAVAAPTNTAPVVAVASPATTASYPGGASIMFSGSANDTQDGNLSASLTWTSSLAGPIGSGASFSRTLPAGTHVITASVTDSGGLRTSNQVTVTVNASAPAVPKPAAPSQLSVALSTSAPTSSLVLSWSDNASNENGYRVERSAGGSFAQIAQVGANVRSYANTNLAAGATYYYRVAAYNGGGVSGYSNTAAGQTAAATAANTAPTVAVASPAKTASYPESASIMFSGSANDTQDGNLSASLTWTSSLAGPIGSGASFSRTLPAGTHLITASVTDSGGLRTSNQVTVTVTVSASAPTPLVGQPTVTSAAASGGILTVAWRAGAGPSATSHRLDFYAGTSRVAVVTAGAGSSIAIPIPAGTQGTFGVRVTAVNGTIAGPASALFSFTIGRACTVPASPDVSGSVIGGTASVRWPAAAGATSYILSAGPTQGGTGYLPPTNIGANTGASASGLAAGFRAWVRVIAINACGQQSAPRDFLVR